MDKSILFVDDEKAILKAVKREFFESDYLVHFALGGEEALEILKNNNIDLVLTDMKMPGMNGYELLKQIKSLYPSTIRIILSGYTDKNMVFECIQNNLAKIYLTKPWNKDELINIVDDIFKTKEILSNNNLLNIINSIENLPTLNTLLVKINKLIEDETSSIDDIVKLIDEDPCLSSKILRIINSGFYGLNTASIKTAILNLGLMNLKTLILATEVFDFKNTNSFNKDLLWKHSSLSNKITSQIHEKLIGKRIPEHYSTAGLLHNIGKMIFLKCFTRKYDKLFQTIEKNPNLSFCQLEKDTFGVTHEEVGAYLLQWWEIPNSVVEAALYHHKPLSSCSMNREIVSIVHVANYYSWKVLYPALCGELHNEVFYYLDIKKSDCELLASKVGKEV